jgi:hypothetical protein
MAKQLKSKKSIKAVPNYCKTDMSFEEAIDLFAHSIKKVKK